MSTPEPELGNAPQGDRMEQDEPEQAGDRYDVTGPEGGDGQPEIIDQQPAPTTGEGAGGKLDIVSHLPLT